MITEFQQQNYTQKNEQASGKFVLFVTVKKNAANDFQFSWLVSACMAWIRRRLNIRDMAIGPKEQVRAKSAQ